MYRLRLGQILKERGMTQADLAEAMQVRPQTVSVWARDNAKSITLEMLTKVCYELGITPNDLFYDDGVPVQEEDEEADQLAVA